MQTIKQVSKQTGLTVQYIRKCIDYMQTTLKLHVHRGKHNAILIDTNGAVIFDQIKQLKDKGLSLPDIQTTLNADMQTEKQVGSKPIETPVKTDDTAIYYVEKLIEAQNLLNEEKDLHLQDVREKEEALRMEKDLRLQELREKEHEISDLIRKNEALNLSLRMLPGGKSPEAIRSEYEADQRKKQEIAQVLGELQSASGLFQGKKRQALLEKLHKLLFEM